jgi:hypothetical protein
MELEDDFPDLGLDTRTATVARMYDYTLGGTDNYQVDRDAVADLLDIFPATFIEARSNRQYLERVVEFMVGECGILQLIDNGSGLPTQRNVHQVAQEVNPGARVVYIDSDPVVLRHQKVSALVASDCSTAFIQEDVRNFDRILDHPDTQRLIRPDEPVGLLYLSILHLIPDKDDPVGLVRRAMDWAAPGSYLAISHGASDDPETRQALNDLFLRATGGNFGRVRETSEVKTFFDGLEVADPGVVKTAGWRAEVPPELRDLKVYEYGGVGRKPA